MAGTKGADMRAQGRARSLTAAALAVVLGAGLLAGCRTGDDDAEPAATPTPTESAEPEPAEPSPTATAEPDDEATSAPVVNGPNSITAPAPGDEVAGPTVTVTGEGTAFEATMLYRVTPAGGSDVVAEGFTTAGANGEVGPYSFEVDLDPGEYTVQVWEPGMGEGDDGGEPRNLVEVTFTVS